MGQGGMSKNFSVLRGNGKINGVAMSSQRYLMNQSANNASNSLMLASGIFEMIAEGEILWRKRPFFLAHQVELSLHLQVSDLDLMQ